jgi:hypothetical protein
MRRVDTKGGLPKVLLQFGMFDDEAQGKLNDVLRKLPVEFRDMLRSSTFEVYECNNITELATMAMFDECEKQVVIDKETKRLYFCALTIDVGRSKTKVAENEFGLYEVTIDDSPRPARVLYFLEVNDRDYRRWRTSNALQRREWIENKMRIEKEELERADRLKSKIKIVPEE